MNDPSTYAKVAAAAAAGDQAAKAAIDALTEVAATITEPQLTGSDLGRAEARRRFGDAR